MRSCYTILLMLLLSVTAAAQTTLVDFEGAAPTYEDFNGSVTTIIDNPDATAPNTSAKVAQNVVPTGASFAGVKITQPVSLADGKTFTMQVYSPMANTPVLLKFEGSIDPIERAATTGAANSWHELSFSFEDEGNLNFDFVVVFMNFNVVGGEDLTFNWDKLTQGGGGIDAFPMTAAPTPTAPVAEVVSIFSDAYTDVMVDTYRTDWSQGDLLDTMIEGNATLKYSNLDFIGIETTSNTVDLASAGVTAMHLDYWSADGTAFAVKLVDFGADGAFGGGDDVEHQLDVTGLTRGAWNSIDLQLNDFTGLATRSNIAQYVLVGMPTATHNIYVDNIYFYQGIVLGTQMDLPVTFDEEGVDYGLVDFGGNASMIVADPEDASNMVAQSTKTVGAALWAGTTLTSAVEGGPLGFASRIPLAEGASTMSVRVWSPTAGTPVMLKVEKKDDPTISVETLVNTTVAGAWDTLTFDFSMERPETAAINYASVYDKASIFFNFGDDEPTVASTYYWDDVFFTGEIVDNGSQMDLPVTFDDADVDYGLAGFGGSNGMIVADPADATNMVGQVIKNAGAELWAGVTMSSITGGPEGFASRIPFAADATTITVRTWSPVAGVTVRLKAEQTNDATVSVETDATTTVAGGWETLTFDFSNHVPETAALNLAAVYGKLSIFFDFGTVPTAEATYYFDDVIFPGGGGGDDTQMDLPVTFDDATVDYGLDGFGGSEGAIVADPEDAANMVGQVIKGAGAMTWAGVTMTSTSGGPAGFANAIPFAADATTISVRTWSPAIGVKVLLKAEQTDDATVSVETEATTTIADGWEILTFDFSNEAAGTAALDLASVYGKLSIFFDFGNEPAAEATYYFDDATFGDIVGTDEPVIGLLEAFPNPVSAAVNIIAPERMQSLTLFSITGQVVGKWTPNTEQFSVEMGHLPTGNYVALVRTDQGLMTIKLLKQ